MRDWLIRTHQNKILGPVTKQKIRELIEKKSLIGFDEVCAKNSFWFKVNEKTLVNKFIFGDEEPTPNPLSEAKDVVNLDKILNEGFQSTDPRYSLPCDTDLEYPSTMAEDNPSDLIPPESIEVEAEKHSSKTIKDDCSTTSKEESDGVSPSEEDLDYPDV